MRCLAFVVAAVLSVNSVAELALNGIGRFEQLREVQFMGALYSETPAASAAELLAGQGHQRIEIRVAKPRIFAKRFRQWWTDGVAINNRAPVLRTHIDNFTYFTNLFDFKLLRGDQIVIERVPDKGVEFIFNTETIGQVDDPAFFNLLLSSWIGDVSLSTDFRDHLLAGGEVNADLLRQFNGYTPAPERLVKTAAVASPSESQDRVSAAAMEIDAADRQTPDNVVSDVVTAGASAVATTVEVPIALAVKNTAIAQAPVAVVELEPQSESEPPAVVAEVAPEGGRGRVSAEALLRRQQYVNDALLWTNKHSRYPRRALATRQQGLVLLNVVLDRDGEVREVVVVQESEHSLLNKAAVRAVKKASPFPPPPEVADEFSMTVPISFKLVADFPG